jgi:hypothetical protein
LYNGLSKLFLEAIGSYKVLCKFLNVFPLPDYDVTSTVVSNKYRKFADYVVLLFLLLSDSFGCIKGLNGLL